MDASLDPVFQGEGRIQVNRGDPDAVVIGAGPNGLVAANTLADAGWRVLVLEAQPTPGGAVRSAELTAPGFVSDVCSSCYPLGVVSPVLQALDLEQHGLRWSHAPLSLAHPTPDGCVAIDPADPAATAASIDGDAPGDGAVWERLYGIWDRAGREIIGALLAPFPPVRASLRAARALGGRDLVRFARLSLWSLDRVAREFRGAGGQLLLGGNMAHTDLSITAMTGALYGWLLACLAQDVGFPVVEGGAGRLADALVARLVHAGGEVRCDARVSKVLVASNGAQGVVTEDGTEIRARRAVLADTSAPSLLLDLVGEAHLARRHVRAMRRFRWDYATVKVDWALDAPIPWDAEPARRAGTIHLVDSLADLRTAGDQLAAGHVPARPFVIVGQSTTADPSRSPTGTEAAWAYAHVPQAVSDDAGGDGITGAWEDGDGERFADRIQAELERRAPGFGARVRARHVLTPTSLEALDANLEGGAVGGGTSALRQQLLFRPVPDWSGGERTPIDNLYLASASAHPGGGVHGACGANAAHTALRIHGD
jgi:phytoene dehydrogenase-like protein